MEIELSAGEGGVAGGSVTNHLDEWVDSGILWQLLMIVAVVLCAKENRWFEVGNL